MHVSTEGMWAHIVHGRGQLLDQAHSVRPRVAVRGEVLKVVVDLVGQLGGDAQVPGGTKGTLLSQVYVQYAYTITGLSYYFILLS
jgi:hypothetical protein